MISDKDIEGLLPRLRRIAHGVVRRHGNYCRSLDVDDLVQEVVETILKVREKLDLGDLHNMLYNITRNIDIKSYRYNERRKTDAMDPADMEFPDPLAHKRVSSGLGYYDLVAAFAKLSVDHRNVLVALQIDGMKVEEAAIHLGIRPGTVKSRASRARDQIELHLGEKPYV